MIHLTGLSLLPVFACLAAAASVYLPQAIVRADAFSEKDPSADGVSIVSDVRIVTAVTPSGQRVERMELMLAGGLPEQLPAADDFSMEGFSYNWMDPNLHGFSARISDVKADGQTLTLFFKNFPEKFFFVDSFRVTCSRNPALSFTDAQVSQVITPVADQFRHVDDDEHDFHYEIFRPADAGAPLPAVIVFHGFGDYDNLRTYRTAVEWAEPEQQKKRPCYVIAPVIRDYLQEGVRDNVYDCLHALLEKMCADGLVDRSRIYVAGNSFGGAASIEFSERFQGYPAAVLAMCPALNYVGRASDALDRLSGTPIWFAHAEHDATIPVWTSEDACRALQEAGNPDAHITVYDDSGMNAAGADPSPDSAVSYHHVEMAVMPDESYKEWLFSHKKER